MKDPVAPDIQDLLPELFGKPDQHFKPGGICSPGSGCGPAAKDSPPDLLKILTSSTAAPSDPTTGVEHHRAVETAAPNNDLQELDN